MLSRLTMTEVGFRNTEIDSRLGVERIVVLMVGLHVERLLFLFELLIQFKCLMMFSRNFGI